MNKPLVITIAKPASSSVSPLLVTPRDAARMMAVSERTLWTWANEGRLPIVQLSTSAATAGRTQRRYAVADLVALIESAKSTNDKSPA